MNTPPPTAKELLAKYQGQLLGSAKLQWTATVLRLHTQDWQARLQTFIQDWKNENPFENQQPAICIAVQTDNHPELVAIDLACHMLGLTLLPLPSFFTHAQTQHALLSSQAIGLICGQGLHTKHIQTIPKAQPHCLKKPVHKITFTSGTTGQPKGVALTWAQQLSVAQQLRAALSKLNIERHLCALPWSILLENIAGVYTPLLQGADLILPSLNELGWQASNILQVSCLVQALATYEAQSVVLMPGMLVQLVDHLQKTGETLPSLKCIAVGGGHVPMHTLNQAQKLQLPVFQGYGLSECASVVCLNTPEANCFGSVGKALPGRILRVDQHGELWVKGQNYQGYWSDLCAGSTSIEKLSSSSTNPWTATGDIATINQEGFVHILGRKKNILITAMGRNVCPEWPEQQLTETGVFSQALVYGEGQDQLSALLVPSSSHINQPNTWQQAVNQANTQLPDYAQIAHVHWILSPWTQAEGLLTPNGRLRRKMILEKHHALTDVQPTMPIHGT